jgi:hypothetical protein
MRVIGQIAMVLLMAKAASAADGWQDTSGVPWTFVGCRDDGFEGSWLGSLRWKTCDWRRNSEQGPIVRSESYSESDEFIGASDGGFFEDDRSHFRLRENDRDTPRKFTMNDGDR